MNQKVLRLIISLMTFSLIGIMGLQYYWISLKISEKAKEFDKSVYKSLASINQDLEEKEAIVFIKNFTQINNSSDSANRVLTRIKHATNLKRDTLLSDQNSYTYVVNVDESDSNSSRLKETLEMASASAIHSISFNEDSELELKLESLEDEIEIVEQKWVEEFKVKRNQLSNAVQQLAIDFTFQDKSLKDRINKIELDSTIKKNLKDEGIVGQDYNYYVLDNSTDSIIFGSESKDKKSTVFNTTIFKETGISPGGTLSIVFNNKTDYILKSIWLSLSVSLLLTAVMIFTFGYTIHSILKEKKLSRIKADFINNMTHEFKTPIATISLAVDSMLHPTNHNNAKEIERFGGIIKKENERMNQQIESVLTAAKFEKGEINLEIEELEVNSIIDELVNNFKLKITSMNGKIEFNKANEPMLILADKMHFYNALRNLIDNAIKFSKSTISVTINVNSIGKYSKITISDKGIGMDKETLNHAFDRFYRKTEGNLHNTKGFGLGLNYVHEIISKLNGSIKLESKLGEGTIVTIEIPKA